jgi:hypothetical protein
MAGRATEPAPGTPEIVAPPPRNSYRRGNNGRRTGSTESGADGPIAPELRDSSIARKFFEHALSGGDVRDCARFSRVPRLKAARNTRCASLQKRFPETT